MLIGYMVAATEKPPKTLVADLFQDGTKDQRVFASSRSGLFSACLSLGPLAPGHTLIFPNFDANSMAGGTRYKKEFDEYRDFHGLISGFLEKEFSAPLVFLETGLHNRDYRSDTRHAHLHVIPSSLPAISLVNYERGHLRDSRSWGQASNLGQFLSYSRAINSGAASYLFVGDSGGALFYRTIHSGEFMPAQFLRSIFWSLTMNVDSFDWREDSNASGLCQLAAQLRHRFTQFSDTGDRISNPDLEPSMLARSLKGRNGRI